MTHRVCIARIRKMADSLRGQGAVLNCAALARECGVDRRFLSRYLTKENPELREELGVIRSRGTDWHSAERFHAYLHAVEAIRKEGDLPSFSTLAVMLRWRRKRVIRYLREHPALTESLGLYSDDEALMFRSARNILARGERVTRLGLADEMGCSYQTVLRVLRARPDWLEDLGICRAERNSGVSLRLYPHRANRH